MAANSNGIDFRDYIRVVFSRGWWFAFVTLFVVAVVSYYSFNATRVYTARNEIKVDDKYGGSISKEITVATDWVKRMRAAQEDLQRSAPAAQIISEAAAAVGAPVSEADLGSMVESFKNNVKLEYNKDGGFVKLSYEASDPKLAAAVLSLFMKQMLAAAVDRQVSELNTEVNTLLSLKASLANEAAEAERRLDEMRTVAPELKLTAATMAMLKSGKAIDTMPSTEQAVGIFLQLQRDIISLDSDIADTSEQIIIARSQLSNEPLTVPARKKFEAVPAVVEATRRRDALRLQLTSLLANSTAEHPMVKEIQAELKGLDGLLQSAANEATVEVVFEANQRRGELERKIVAFESDLAGLKVRRANMEANAETWRRKLDDMPAQWREIREITLDYEKKTDNLSLITDRLVQAQIRRSLAMDQVATYYNPEHNITPVPVKYDKPRHAVHLMLGLILGMMASVFVVYSIEFADHSVKDQRDLRAYTKTAVLGVISDFNQLKAVARRTPRARAAILRQYLLVLLFVGCTALLAYGAYDSWPRPQKASELPAVLGADTVSSIEDAMRLYGAPSIDLEAWRDVPRESLDVLPAIEVPLQEGPRPVLSE